MNRRKEARKVLEKLLEIDPLNHQARYEQYLLRPNKKNLYVRVLMGNKQFEKPAEILENLVALPSEGASGVHQLFSCAAI